ncbi:hypothetical protein Tco_0215132 [Tanacetum coccineum]
MTTLADKSLLSGGDNKPQCLKHLDDSEEPEWNLSQHHVAKDLWEKIKLLMQGTSLTKQERECKLYDEFDKFTYKKGECCYIEYY